MSQEAGGAAKPLFLGQNAKFFGQKPADKNEKNLCLLNEKNAFIPSSEMKCPKSGIFTNNYSVGRVGQSSFAG